MTAAGRCTLASVTAVLTVVLPGSVVNALPAAAEPLTVGAVTVVDDQIDVSDGFGILAVDIELSDPEGIPDEIAHNIMGDPTVLALEPGRAADRGTTNPRTTLRRSRPSSRSTSCAASRVHPPTGSGGRAWRCRRTSPAPIL